MDIGDRSRHHVPTITVGEQMLERSFASGTDDTTLDGWHLQLLQGFDLKRNGASVELPSSAQRVLAFLAVARRPLNRLYVASVLWPDSHEARASGNLRSTLWRVQRIAPGLVVSIGARISIAAGIRVDFHDVVARALQVISAAQDGDEWIEASDFAFDLLPDWYEDWLTTERERLHQLELHALEALSARQLARSNFAQAVEAAQLAVAAEPTRETAQGALIKAHLAEGNLSEAIRQFESFRRLLALELGVEPSRRLAELVRGAIPGHSGEQ
jgi:DNA-binding SARP family transcriptional activator